LHTMVNVAKKHGVLPLLALGLKQNALLTQNDAVLEKSILMAVYRYQQLNFTFENLCTILESEKIPFMPLKGSVIRKYYPEPWMRESCDIDILVHREDLEKASKVLVEQYQYTYHEKGSHDVSFFAPNKTHVELHFDLVEDEFASKSSEVLKTVWETATVCEGCNYRYEMPDKMFYFYHIAHMAKHFETGGCGIRPLIDLWILDNLNNADLAARNELLKQGSLLKFAEAARHLSKVWFEKANKNTVSQCMEDYILQGGIYGSNENRVIFQQQKKGGKIKYALAKIFIPYDVIKYHYPILQKHRWLTPFMEVRRWFKLIFCGHTKRTLNELKYNSEISTDRAEITKALLSELGL